MDIEGRKVAIPNNADDLQDFLSTKHSDVEQIFATKEKATTFIEEYRKNANDYDPELKEQSDENFDKKVRDVLEAEGLESGRKPKGRLPMSGDVGDIYKDFTPHQKRQLALTGEGPGMELNSKWANLGEFIKDVWSGKASAEMTLAKALGEATGDGGGFLVAEEFRAQLASRTLENVVVRPRATVIPMGSSSLSFPAIRDTSHASTVFGGVWGSWTPEGGAITMTREPTFSQVRLEAKKLTAGTRISNELRRDSAIALDQVIGNLFGSAFQYLEDDAFITGNGAGMPLGIKNADALVSVAKETGQSASTIVWENIIKMFARMTPQSLGSAVWVAHPDTIPQLATMSLTVGTGGNAVWNANGQGPLPTTLLGRPIIYSEKAETVGTAGDIYFVDFSQYLIGDRQSLEVRSSEHSRFANDQTEFIFIQRLDGKPIVDSAVTPRNGSNTMSPYINLAVRS